MTGAGTAGGVRDDAAPPSGGAQLRRARLALNLAASEVARSLRLKPEVVIALEDERFEGLSPTYLRGYLRGYARIVGLDPEAIVGACAGIKDSQVAVEPCSTTHELRRLGGANPALRFGTYAVVTVLGFLLAASWRAQYAPSPEEAVPPVETPAPTAAEAEMVTSAGGSYRYPIIQHPEQLPRPVADPVETPAPEEPPPAEATRAPPAEATGTPADAGQRLVLEVAANSWAEVKDAYGAKLYYNLATKGQTITLKGQAPFTVVLGNAAGVAVFYNGKPVDVGAWSHGGVARFKVGAEGPAG